MLTEFKCPLGATKIEIIPLTFTWERYLEPIRDFFQPLSNK